MASTVSEQDGKPNPGLWFGTWEGNMALFCPFGITRSMLRDYSSRCFFIPYNKSFIDQACLVKMAA